MTVISVITAAKEIRTDISDMRTLNRRVLILFAPLPLRLKALLWGAVFFTGMSPYPVFAGIELDRSNHRLGRFRRFVGDAFRSV
jgi:hypothetical protein